MLHLKLVHSPFLGIDPDVGVIPDELAVLVFKGKTVCWDLLTVDEVFGLVERYLIKKSLELLLHVALPLARPADSRVDFVQTRSFDIQERLAEARHPLGHLLPRRSKRDDQPDDEKNHFLFD